MLLAAAGMSTGIWFPLRERTSLRTPLFAAAAIGLAFFGGFGGWAATVPLAGAVLAPAVVVPEGSRKQVQHLEDRIVRRILVQDGNRVAAGQPLVELDDTSARAAHAGLLARWLAMVAATTWWTGPAIMTTLGQIAGSSVGAPLSGLHRPR